MDKKEQLKKAKEAVRLAEKGGNFDTVHHDRLAELRGKREEAKPKKKPINRKIQLTLILGFITKTTTPMSIYAIPAVKRLPNVISRSGQVNRIVETDASKICSSRLTVYLIGSPMPALLIIFVRSFID